MSITVADLQTNTNTFVGDTSTDRISAAERLQAMTEATVWVMEELGNDLQNYTQEIEYYDTVNYYKVTTDIADLLEGGDLRRSKDEQDKSFTHKSSRELAEDIGQCSNESSWTIERRDTDTFVGINHGSKYSAKGIEDCDSLTNSGTWAADTSGSDALNLTVDEEEFKTGTGSFNFDLVATQSANDYAIIQNTTMTAMDLSEYEDISSFLFQVYIPDKEYTTSFTLYWGSDTSNYWSATATTDMDGAAWSDGWNRVKIAWEDATKTGSPDIDNIDYVGIKMIYNASQGDDTDYRIDDIILCRPEKLTFHYITWKLGVDNSGDDIFAFGATTDVPYFSGMYDQLKYPVAHKAAAILFNVLRLREDAMIEDKEATKTLSKIKRLIPSSRTKEVKSFKVLGNNLNK